MEFIIPFGVVIATVMLGVCLFYKLIINPTNVMNPSYSSGSDIESILEETSSENDTDTSAALGDDIDGSY